MSEKKFDVFISFKNLDSEGNQTLDSYIGRELYNALTAEGIHTFYSPVSLEEEGGSRYAPLIDSALDDAKILVLVLTKAEYATARWVEHEWNNFQQEYRSGRKNDAEVFTLTMNVQPAELPLSLRNVQNFSYDKEVENLISFIKSRLGKETSPYKMVMSANKVSELQSLEQQLEADEKMRSHMEEYVSRTDLECKVDSCFESGEKVVGLVGGPGSGKTLLAMNYAKQCCMATSPLFEVTLQIDCETKAAFCQSLHLENVDEKTDLKAVVENKLESFLKGRKALLLFDNITFDQKLLTGEKPVFERTVKEIITHLVNKEDGNVSVLYTSRRSEVFKTTEFVVKDFDESGEEAEKYLEKNISFKTSRAEIAEVISVYGRLPIVLSTVKFLANASGGYGGVKKNIYNSFDTDKTLVDLLDDLLKRLGESKNGETFARLMKIAALLPPKFEKNILEEVAEEMGLYSFAVHNAMDEYMEKIMLLTEAGNGFLSIHRSYQEALLKSALVSGDEVKKIAQAIINVMKRYVKWQRGFSYYQADDIKRFEECIDRLFRLDIERHEMAEILMAYAFFVGYHVNMESEKYEQYFDYLVKDKKVNFLIKASAICDNALIVCKAETKKVDKIKKELQLVERGLKHNDEKELPVLVKLSYANSFVERALGNKDNAYSEANKCADYCRQGKEILSPYDDDAEIMYMFYHQYQAMASDLKGQIARQVERNHKKGIFYCEEGLEFLDDLDIWEFYLGEEAVQDMNYVKAKLLNAKAVNLAEENGSEEQLDEAARLYWEVYELYKEKELWLGMENQIANMSQYYSKKARYHDKEDDIEQFEKYMYMARFYLDAGYSLREQKCSLDKSYLRVYYSYKFDMAYSWIKHPAPEKIRTIEYEKDCPKLGWKMNSEIRACLPLEKWVRSKGTKNDFIRLWIVEAQENLGESMKYVHPDGMNDDADIAVLIKEVEYPYPLLQLYRYKGILYRKQGQIEEEPKEYYEKAEKCYHKVIVGGRELKIARACQFAYRELVILYEVQGLDEMVKKTLMEMQDVYKEIDQENGIGKWYNDKCQKYGVEK